MNAHRAATIAILFILVLLAVWTAASYLPGNVVEGDTAAGVILSHSRAGNEHTYAGTVSMSAPCDVVSSDLSVAYSRPPRAKIALTIARPKGAVCAKRPATTDFSVSVISKDVPQVSLTIDGNAVPVSVVEK